MDNSQKIFLSKFSAVEPSGGLLNVPLNEEWSCLENISEHDAFYYIIEGRCDFVIDGEEYDGIPGRMFFIPAGVAFSCRSDEGIVAYWLRMKLYPYNINVLKLFELPYYFDAKNPDIIQFLFNDFMESVKGVRVVDKLHTKSCVFQLFFEYIIQAKSDTLYVDRGKDEMIYRVIDYIDRNIEMNLSNSDLAKMCHLHPNHFTRFFKKKTGYTPARYIRLKKMEKAKKLMEETELSVVEIMYRVGYDDASYFSKAFKSVYGSCPRMYKLKLRNPSEK